MGPKGVNDGGPSLSAPLSPFFPLPFSTCPLPPLPSLASLSKRAEPSLPEMYFDSVRKNAHLTLPNTMN